jgi:hypothetical protein
MRLFKNRQMRLRMLAVVAEAVLFYMVFIFINHMLQGSRINILFFILTALCGLFLNLLPYHSTDKRYSTVLGFVGLALALASLGLSAMAGFRICTLPLGFAALVFLYYRSYTGYLANIIYIYTPQGFYKALGLMFLLNGAAALWRLGFGAIAAALLRYSVLYTVLGLYILSEIKNFRYVSGSESGRKSAFDTTATILMLLVTVVMSIPKVFHAVSFPFVYVFGFIYGWVAKGILLITYPFARVMGYFYSLIPELPEKEGRKADFGGMLGIQDQYKGNVGEVASPFVQLLGKLLASLILLALCAFAVYLLFKFIARINRAEEEEDFQEEKEFILRNKKREPGFLSRLGDTLKKTADDFAFRLRADNRDKLRMEYKGFLQTLYAKKLVETQNHTAQELLQLLRDRLPDKASQLSVITELYEEVRYGTKYPQDTELKSFKKNIAEVSKSVQLQ